MREITEHQVNECNQDIKLEADERDPLNGNASHVYKLSIARKDGVTSELVFEFQHGPIKEVGVNGITQEVLLAILIDRLRGFQTSKWACVENEVALMALMEARDSLFQRTLKRVDRGVEGTHEV